MRRARDRKTISYSELGAKVEIPVRGPWKPILDKISKDQTALHRPDVTFVVINKRTKLPAQIDFKIARAPSAAQRVIAEAEIRKVFDHYAPPRQANEC